MRYPHLFQKFGVLDKSLAAVTEKDIIIFIHAEEQNMSKLKNYGNVYEQKKKAQHPRLREIIGIAEQKQQSEEQIEPFSPKVMFEFIQQGDMNSFKRNYEGIKKIVNDGVNKEEANFFMYMGYQISEHEQIAEFDFIPQDEAI